MEDSDAEEDAAAAQAEKAPPTKLLLFGGETVSTHAGAARGAGRSC